MKKTLKRILATFLTVIMLFSALPLAGINLKANALASSGKCGDNVSWSFNSSTGTLTISGTENMYDYEGVKAPFYHINSIKNVIIKKDVTSIGNYAFYWCENLTSITIPDSVTSIGDSAFGGCINLASITIPNSVKSIGDFAFYDCNNLTSITIPNSVTNIGDFAFSYCTSLTSITIPDSVTSIGDSAFDGCTNLASITIPDSVTSIGEGAFSYCTNLTSITVDKNNPVYDSRENCNAIIESATNTLIFGCQNTIISDSVASIGDFAFPYCTSLTSITIPDSVTSIGEGAFYNCKNLTSVTISNSVTSIGDFAFSSCHSLASVTIGNGVKNIGDYAFSHCDNLTDVYYNGTEEQWKKINIDEENECLTNATIHYNSSGDTPSSTNYINGTFKFRSSSEEKDVEYAFTYSDDYFMTDGGIYNADLANVSLKLALSAFNSASVSGYSEQKGKNVKEMLEKCKFTDIQLNDYYKEKPSINSIGACIGRKDIGDTTLIAVAIRGGGYESEWAGNFNAYTDGNIHPGFETAATKVENFILEYLLKHDDLIDGRRLKFWVVGYSRAGATANLVSAYLGDQSYAEHKDIYAYTFEAPQPTKKAKYNTNYDYIFNIINPTDIVPKVVMSDWGYARYGQTVYLPCAYNLSYDKLSKIEQDFRYLLILGGFDFFNGKYSFPFLTTQGQMSDLLASILADYLGDASTDRTLVLSFLLQQWQLSKYGNETEISKDDVISFFALQLAYYFASPSYKISYKSLKSTLTTTYLKCLSKIATLKSDDPNILEGLPDVLAKLIWNYLAIVLEETPTEIDAELLANAKDYFIDYVNTISIPHYPEFTLATLENCNDIAYSSGYLEAKINCPVNVSVYDSNNKLVAQIVDDKATKIENSTIGAYIDADGQKVICLPKDQEYRIETTGTGTGDVNYQISEFDVGTESYTKIVNYYNVPITPGKKLIGTTNGEKSEYTLKYESNSSYLTPEITNASNIKYYNVDVISDGNGDVFGNTTKVVGEFAQISASPLKNYSFDGWYVNNKFVSNEENYRFKVTGDISLVAKFVKSVPTVNSVSINDIELKYKNTAKIVPQISVDDGVNYTIKYESSNPSVATVDKNGNISTVHKGTTTITCTVTDEYGNVVKDTCTVNVKFQWWQWLIWILLFGFLWY